MKAIELKMINYFNSFPQNKTIYVVNEAEQDGIIQKGLL